MKKIQPRKDAFAEAKATVVKVKIKIATYNIANGRGCDHEMQKLADDILAVAPDVIGLQEVDRFCKRSKFMDSMKVLTELTGYKYSHYTKTINLAGDPATYGCDGEYGTAVFSKHPIISAESVLLDSAHFEQRAYSKCRININGCEFLFCNTHLTYESADKRREQLKTIAEVLKNEKSFFLTGDFNTENFDDFSSIENGNLTNNNTTRFESFPSERIAIDNIVYSNDFTRLDANTYPSTNSDHIMLWAEFEKN